jgi:hypothetical protein
MYLLQQGCCTRLQRQQTESKLHVIALLPPLLARVLELRCTQLAERLTAIEHQLLEAAQAQAFAVNEADFLRQQLTMLRHA